MDGRIDGWIDEGRSKGWTDRQTGKRKKEFRMIVQLRNIHVSSESMISTSMKSRKQKLQENQRQQLNSLPHNPDF